MADKTEKLIAERHNQHGDWREQALLAYNLKTLMHSNPHWSMLPPSKAEALDMIATKISRIISGNYSNEDHWDDIAGYVMLAKQEYSRIGELEK